MLLLLDCCAVAANPKELRRVEKLRDGVSAAAKRVCWWVCTAIWV